MFRLSRLRSIGLLLACGAFALPLSSRELPLETILSRHVDAIGGTIRLNSMQTIAVRAQVRTSDGAVSQLYLQKKRPSKVRSLLTRPDGSRFTQGFDGQTPWLMIEHEGRMALGEMAAPIAAGFIRNAPIENALVNPRLHRAELEYHGLETIEGGIRTHHIEARLPDGSRTHYYLDTSTFLERKYVSITLGPDGVPQSVASFPSDYRPVEGILVAFRSIERSEPDQRVEIILDEVTINVGILDTIFAIPDAQRVAPF